MMNFKPSQVLVDIWLPFVATFDRYEVELTAAFIVKALALRGDEWRIIECSELAQVFSELTKPAGVWREMWDNPFAKVDMHDLVKRGFAEWRHDGKAIELTDAARNRMAKWVRQTEAGSHIQ